MIPLCIYHRTSPVIVTPPDYELEDARYVKHGTHTFTVASYVHFDDPYDRVWKWYGPNELVKEVVKK